MDIRRRLVPAAWIAGGRQRRRPAGLAQAAGLTCDEDNPNGADIRFYVDGASTDAFEGYERIVFLFDAADSEAVDRARQAWLKVKAEGRDATYWRQDETGRWAKQG